MSRPVVKWYRGSSGVIHAQANSTDEHYGLVFPNLQALQEAFKPEVLLQRVPREEVLKSRRMEA